MAEPINIQDWIDGRLDIKSLGEAANGDENTQVITRLGETYPSAKKAITEGIIKLFENGALPAKPFPTKAVMTTDGAALANDSYAMVTNEQGVNVSNNGLYVKTAGVWFKAAYDPVQIANNHTDAKIGTLNISKDAQPDLHVFSDNEDNVVAKIDANSELHLTGLAGSVQENLNNPKSLGINKVTNNVLNMTHVWTDDNDDILMSLRNDGGLMLTDSTVSLQEQIDLHTVTHPRKLDPKQMFSDACTPYFLNMSVSGLKNAPVPFGLLPQKYTVPDSIINAFTVTAPIGYIPIDSPYGTNDKVVHPAVIEVRGAFRGYRYLMCINPYSVESHENPVIYGSNSLDSGWEMLTGFYQPLEEPKSGRYFSDSGFSYDPINGMLICFWRDGSSVASGSDQYVKYRATRDGIQWTPTKTLFSITAGTGHISPSMLFNPNDGLWHFWSGVNTSEVAHYTARNLDDSWVLAGNGTVFGMWHSEVKFAGDKYLMLANDRDPESNYRLAISSDGNTWQMGTDLFTTQQDALYKASYITDIRGDELSLDILYTTNHTVNPANKRRLYHVKTNTVSIGA